MRQHTFRLAIFAVIVGVLASSPAGAQTFDSGSTGAGGALDLATMNCETGPYAPLLGQAVGCWIQLPESGILNYTTISVPLGKTLNFRKNRQNTPVVLLAQGDVVVGGTISVDGTTWLPENRGDQTVPGPGGFPGGARTTGVGLGPGGGTTENPSGRWVGPLSLVPIVGGSGGAAWTPPFSSNVSGGGGAGAIVIASSGEIRITGGLTACPNVICNNGGGSNQGSGGAVRLVANRITMVGYVSTRIWGCNYTPPNNPGIVRLEAPSGALSYTGSSDPAPILSTINPTIVATAAPDLRIVSVGGFLVPDSAGYRFDAADLVLPAQLPDPINVVVAAANIPVGSPVTVSFGTTNAGTAPAAALAGSLASSTATIGVSGLNRSQLAYLYVQVLFAPPGSGEGVSSVPESGRVTKVRMTAAPGEKPRYAFLRRDGGEVPVQKLPANLQQWVSKQYSH